MRPCPENKWPFSPALQNAWESLDYKANIGPVTNKEDSDQPAYPRCQNLVCLHQKSMNSENVDTEPSLQMHKLPSVLFLRGWWVWGVGQGTLFFGGGEGRVHSAQGTTQFVDHKLTRIIQKELQSLIKYFVRS